MVSPHAKPPPPLTRGRALSWAHRLKGVVHHLRNGYPVNEPDAWLIDEIANEITDWARTLTATMEVQVIVEPLPEVDDAADTKPIMHRPKR